MRVGSYPGGGTEMALATTLPAVPAWTALTPTLAWPGSMVTLPMIRARGMRMSEAVAKPTPAEVLTTDPPGTSTERPVSKFWKVTVPVAFVSLTLTPVVGNVSLALSWKVTVRAGTTRRVASTAVAAGSATTVRATGPMAWPTGVIVMAAEGSTVYRPKPRTPRMTIRPTTTAIQGRAEAEPTRREAPRTGRLG